MGNKPVSLFLKKINCINDYESMLRRSQVILTHRYRILIISCWRLQFYRSTIPLLFVADDGVIIEIYFFIYPILSSSISQFCQVDLSIVIHLNLRNISGCIFLVPGAERQHPYYTKESQGS